MINTTFDTALDPALRSLDDKSLIEMTLAGNQGCFNALMERHLRIIRKRVASMIANDAEAEDVLQEVQLKVWTHLGSFRHDSSFRTWLTRVAINEALQSIRRAKKGQETDPIDLDRLAAPTDSPERLYARQEIECAIRRAIRQLPTKFQQILVLREFREMSVKETARELNSNLPLVKTRLFRARMMLLKVLKSQRKKSIRGWRAEAAA